MRCQLPIEQLTRSVAHIYTVAFQGIEAREVDVQVHVSDTGNGQFNIVGLADKAAAESKECVRVALSACTGGLSDGGADVTATSASTSTSSTTTPTRSSTGS